MKIRIFAALLALFAAARALADPTPLFMQIDRTLDPSPICANRTSTASGCQIMGYMSSGGVYSLPPNINLSGTPTASTAAVDTNSTRIATTAFVIGQASSATPLINGSAAVGTSLRYSRGDHVHPTDTTRAPANFTASGTGAVARTVNAKLADSVNVADYGAVGDGSTDDKAAIDLATASIGDTGGVVNLQCDKRYRVTTLVIPDRVTLRGCHSNPDNPGGYNQSAPYDEMGAILLPSTTATTTGTATSGGSTITVASASGIIKGMSVQSVVVPGGSVVTNVNGTTITVDSTATGTTGAVLTCTITTSSGSTYATCSGGPAGILTGATVTGTGIAAATTVSGIDQNNNIILSNAATATASVNTATFTNPSNPAAVFRAAVTLKANAGVENILLHRYGMTFPAANASGYGGNAFVCGYRGDGCFANNVLVIGFEYAFISAGVSKYAFANSRVRLKNFNYDTVNGIKISGSGDTNVLRDVKAWPWGTVGNGDPDVNLQNRSGTGLLLQGQNDDTELDGISIIGHAINYDFDATGAVFAGRLWSDYNITSAGSSIGVRMGANSTRINITHLYLSGSDAGLSRAANAGETAVIGVVECSQIRTACLSVSGGDLTVGAINASLMENLMTVSSTSSYVNIGVANFRTMIIGRDTTTPSTSPIAIVSGVNTGHIKIGSFSTDLAAGYPIFVNNALIHCTMVAAATINLDPNCLDIDLTAFAGVSLATMNGGWGGRNLRIYFDGVGTVKHNTGNIRSATVADVATTNGGFMSLTFDGTLNKWRENYHGN